MVVIDGGLARAVIGERRLLEWAARNPYISGEIDERFRKASEFFRANMHPSTIIIDEIRKKVITIMEPNKACDIAEGLAHLVEVINSNPQNGLKREVDITLLLMWQCGYHVQPLVSRLPYNLIYG